MIFHSRSTCVQILRLFFQNAGFAIFHLEKAYAIITQTYQFLYFPEVLDHAEIR